MRVGTVAAMGVAVVGILAAVWLGLQWQAEREARQSCEASLQSAGRSQQDVESRSADLIRSLEQERQARLQQEQDLRQLREQGDQERQTLGALRQKHDALTRELQAAEAAQAEQASQLQQAQAEQASQLEQALARAAQLQQAVLACQATLDSQAAEAAQRLQALQRASTLAQQQLATLQQQLETELNTQPDTTAGNQTASQTDAQAEARTVEISRQDGGLQVTVLGEVLFSSGSRRLRPQGRVLLSRMAAALKDLPDGAVVQVIGHTDAVPIQPKMRWLFDSNLDLSVARAAAVAGFLPRQARLDPARFYALGRADHDPVADNDSPRGRALNRRVVIRILQAEQAQEWLGGS
ncbi:OmpA/MotB family protein [Megalodesulfovibrio gigas]|uniref:Putative OmpA/MotB domain protein n=1 Tax=Megalodesulfovibrio gigas (strain ATCC 19364 / DSM 1382 / NCIMB 9332 / VKM B-1759) TaxID=1121448 RepID=T2GCN4_MEGG1|nr:OmpA family protein [Megalodesulfovibrio gigas]AGW14340.1 putative OmpA/MotB domain protein [Megalodesulfovibrio gigas DSM 1382 = ATCC 19364]